MKVFTKPWINHGTIFLLSKQIIDNTHLISKSFKSTLSTFKSLASNSSRIHHGSLADQPDRKVEASRPVQRSWSKPNGNDFRNASQEFHDAVRTSTNGFSSSLVSLREKSFKNSTAWKNTVLQGSGWCQWRWSNGH